MSKKPKDWKTLRLDLIRKILRLDISAGAKNLWVELALNWCWEGPECCPHQNVLAVALRSHRNTVMRWAKELADLGLLSKRKHYRGFRFTLTEEIPEGLLEEAWRFNNAALTRRVRGKTPLVTQRVAMHQNSDRDDTTAEPHALPVDSDMHQNSDRDPKTRTKLVHGHALKQCMYRSTMHLKADEEEEKADESERERPGEPVAVQDGLVDSSVEGKHEGKQRTYVAKDTQPPDPSELMEDLQPKTQHPKTKRTLRGPSKALVTSEHSLGSAGEPPAGSKVVEASPPPPKKPEDVLALLRGEIEAKYGAKGCRKMPLALTGKEKSQVRKILLTKYAPDVVISLVRVLVWDWEVARSSCFPFRPQVRIPTIEALIQYQETLASAVDIGLKYDGIARGNWNTYSNRYLADSLLSEDPF